jgi:probable rRNA maturation factor
VSIIIQRLSHLRHIPDDNILLHWIKSVLNNKIINKKNNQIDITVRIVNKKESAELNKLYRQKSGPTNVLSFVYSIKPVCGDIVLCAPIIREEKTWAHLVIHGILHLLGYDHIKIRDAKIMESLEIKLLKKLGFENPYLSL